MSVLLLRQSTSQVTSALAFAACLAGMPAASAQVRAAELPAAPSFVLTQQTSLPAGSGMTFKASAITIGPGGVAVELPQSGPLSLSLDDAISFALKRNLRVLYDQANQREVKGNQLNVVNALLPSLRFQGQSSTQEINLAAMGFKPSLLAGSPLLPPGAVLAEIVKVDVTQVTISANQQLFNLSAYELYRGAKSESNVVTLNGLNSRGDVVLTVGTAYLKVLADQSNVADAQAEEQSAKVSFDQATARLHAGVGTNLDALRAQVDYQQRQQTSIAEANALAKDIIQLNRIMGLPAGQELTPTDTAPFAQFTDMDLDAAKTTAYAHRKDFLSLQAQIDVTSRELRAVKYQRLPTVAFNGFYGLIGETEGLYHGAFRAVGSVNFPIFREAAQRGEEEQVDAQLMALRQRDTDLRVAIDSQIRAAMLDVNAANDLVKVAQSNVELAAQELSDERDRFTAGVDTNLPVVDAQASVAGANAQLVSALYQYNVAKLNLARNTGIIESQYRTYLGK